jgi:hypothetical protein
MKEKIQELTDLFTQTEHAHRRAFSETDGFDIEWPIWYADYLIDRLPPLLEASMSRSDVVYLLVHLSRIQPAEAPGANWSRYYARYLVERYL